MDSLCSAWQTGRLRWQGRVQQGIIMSYSPFRVILHGRIASRHDFGKGCVLFLLRIALRFLMIMPRGAYNSRPGGGGPNIF